MKPWPVDVAGGAMLRLGARDSDGTLRSGEHHVFGVEAETALTPAEVTALWSAMRDLPTAIQSRCHVPGYALRLDTRDHATWIAALCWRCNNISIAQDGTFTWQTFDAGSPEAQALLDTCRAKLP